MWVGRWGWGERQWGGRGNGGGRIGGRGGNRRGGGRGGGAGRREGAEGEGLGLRGREGERRGVEQSGEEGNGAERSGEEGRKRGKGWLTHGCSLGGETSVQPSGSSEEESPAPTSSPLVSERGEVAPSRLSEGEAGEAGDTSVSLRALSITTFDGRGRGRVEGNRAKVGTDCRTGLTKVGWGVGSREQRLGGVGSREYWDRECRE